GLIGLDGFLQAVELVDRLLPIAANRSALRRIVARGEIGPQRVDARLECVGERLVAIHLRLEVFHAVGPVRLILDFVLRAGARATLTRAAGLLVTGFPAGLPVGLFVGRLLVADWSRIRVGLLVRAVGRRALRPRDDRREVGQILVGVDPRRL